jgi:hypothetical protein
MRFNKQIALIRLAIVLTLAQMASLVPAICAARGAPTQVLRERQSVTDSSVNR